MLRLTGPVWRRISPLLDQALDLDTAGRAALLDDIRRDEPEVAAVLARLLAVHEQLRSSSFLATPPAIAAAWRSRRTR